MNINFQLLMKVADIKLRERFETLGYHLPPVPLRFHPVLPEEAADYFAGRTMYGDNFDRDTEGAPATNIWVSAATLYRGRRPGPHYAVATLAHELIHVATQPVAKGDGYLSHYEPEFLDLLDEFNLVGDPTATRGGDAFNRWVDDVVMPAYEAVAREAGHAV